MRIRALVLKVALLSAFIPLASLAEQPKPGIVRLDAKLNQDPQGRGSSATITFQSEALTYIKRMGDDFGLYDEVWPMVAIELYQISPYAREFVDWRPHYALIKNGTAVDESTPLVIVGLWLMHRPSPKR